MPFNNTEKINEYVCYQYVGEDGEMELLILDPAGIPMQKSKIKHIQGVPKPTKNQVIITKTFQVGMANIFEYCFFLQNEENDYATIFKNYTDEDWYSMYADIENDIPYSSKEHTLH